MKPNSLNGFADVLNERLELNSCLNNARSLLVEFARGSDAKIATLAAKNLLMLSLVRNSIEDSLILASVLEEKAAKAESLDVREELQVMYALMGNKESKGDQVESDFKLGARVLMEVGDFKMRMLHEGWNIC
jgi:hypothetical protein